MVRHNATDILTDEQVEYVKNYLGEVDIPDSFHDL